MPSDILLSPTTPDGTTGVPDSPWFAARFLSEVILSAFLSLLSE
jgi:hypothetical protein